MKFYKYLTEELNINDIITLLDKHCKPFINDWKKLNIKEFLYSGRDIINTDFEKKTVRKNRKPLTTPLHKHNLMDDWFYKKFGIKARSNSIFCTFDIQVANSYGRSYMIFPIGKYTAISSKYVDDLFINISEYDVDINDVLNKGDYKNKLQEIDGEVMIHCKDYYLVRYYPYFKSIYNHFKGY